MTESIIKHITPAGGNVFLDLGFPPDEAAALKAENPEVLDPAFKLTERESLRLAEILEHPPERNEKFLAAQARYDKIKESQA